VVSNDRPARVPQLSPTPAAPGSELSLGPALRQTASFLVGDFRLDLAVTPGGISLIVSLGADRDVYLLEPGTLGAWAKSTSSLLQLDTAATPSECAGFRAPFLMDVHGRAAIALECLVSERAVEYQLLVMGASGRAGATPTDVDLVRSLVEAARGAVLVTSLP
jgi:hypothetical protein